MKTRFLFLALFLGILSTVYASYFPGQIPLHSPIYEELDLLYQLSGQALPSASRPWNTYEAVQILNSIPSNIKHSALRDQIEQRLLQRKTSHSSSQFSYRITPTIALESYIHTNDTDFTSFSDWVYSYDDRKPMLDLTLSMEWGSSFLFETSLQAQVAGYSDKHDENTATPIPSYGIGVVLDNNAAVYLDNAYLYRSLFNTNILTSNKDLEADFPRHSQMTFAGDWWTLSLGRGRVSWGRGMSGNLVIGDHISNHTYASASFFSDAAKLQLMYLFFPDFTVAKRGSRAFIGHRFEFRMSNWARLSISENIMALSKDFPLQYADPTYIYHNIFNPDSVNAIAHIEVDFALAPGISLHGQFAMDQFQLPSEQAPTANALAYLAGISYAWQDKNGYWIADMEYACIDPAFYRREGVDFLVARDLMKHQGHINAYIIDYLGHRYGSDSQILMARGTYILPNTLRLEGSVTIHRQGELTYLDAHNPSKNNNDIPTINGPAPSGDTISERLIIGLGADYTTSIEGLSLYSQAHWIGKRVYDRPSKSYDSYAYDLQLVVGIQKRF